MAYASNSYIINPYSKNDVFHEECFHAWVECGSSVKAAAFLAERWGNPSYVTVTKAAHSYVIHHPAEAKQYLRDHGQVFSDDAFEKLVIRRVGTLFLNHTSLDLKEFERWMSENTWAEKYRSYFEARIRTKGPAYRGKPSKRDEPVQG